MMRCMYLCCAHVVFVVHRSRVLRCSSPHSNAYRHACPSYNAGESSPHTTISSMTLGHRHDAKWTAFPFRATLKNACHSILFYDTSDNQCGPTVIDLGRGIRGSP